MAGGAFKASKTQMTQAIIGVLVLFNLVKLPLSSSLFAFGAAFIWYGFTRSLPAVAVILAIPALIKVWNAATGVKPIPRRKAAAAAAPESTEAAVALEGFQANAGAVQVAQRLQAIRGPAPLAPAAVAPTGVLESPEILSASPLEGFQDTPAEAEGGAPESTRASVLGPLVPINPPAESAIPAAGIQERPIRSNHALSEDEESQETALTQTGTGLPDADQPAVLNGISAGTAASV